MRQKIIKLMSDGTPRTSSEIAKAVECSRQYAMNVMRELVANKEAKIVDGEAGNAREKRYVIEVSGIAKAHKAWAAGKLRLVATAEQFELMLTRNASAEPTPEMRLVLAVLGQAARDAQAAYKKYIESYIPKNPERKNYVFKPISAKALLLSEEFRFWTDGHAGEYGALVGLDSVFVLEQFCLYLGLNLDALRAINGGEFEARLMNAVVPA